jgi:hypothetical protein
MDDDGLHSILQCIVRLRTKTGFSPHLEHPAYKSSYTHIVIPAVILSGNPVAPSILFFASLRLCEKIAFLRESLFIVYNW